MKQIKLNTRVVWIVLISLLYAFSADHYQDARKDAVLFSMGRGACKGNMVQMAVKNNSTTQKIDVLIVKKETTNEFSTTSTAKYSGLPPGYKQPVGCSGRATSTDSLVVTYSVASAVYEK